MKTRGNSTSELRTSVTHRQVNFTSWWVAPDGWCHASRGSVVMTSECNTSLQFHREYFCFSMPSVEQHRIHTFQRYWCGDGGDDDDVEITSKHVTCIAWGQLESYQAWHFMLSQQVLYSAGHGYQLLPAVKVHRCHPHWKKKLRKKLTIDLKYPPKIANNSKPKYIKHEGGK